MNQLRALFEISGIIKNLPPEEINDFKEELILSLIEGNELFEISPTILSDEIWKSENEVPAFSIKEGMYAVGEIFALDPLIYPPPKGVKLTVITEGGIQCNRSFSEDAHIAWFPLVKTPKTVKDRRNAEYARINNL